MHLYSDKKTKENSQKMTTMLQLNKLKLKLNIQKNIRYWWLYYYGCYERLKVTHINKEYNRNIKYITFQNTMKNSLHQITY